MKSKRCPSGSLRTRVCVCVWVLRCLTVFVTHWEESKCVGRIVSTAQCSQPYLHSSSNVCFSINTVQKVRVFRSKKVSKKPRPKQKNKPKPNKKKNRQKPRARFALLG
ncbi:hypothetical protein DFJ73DRAFT_874706 [Zopfochytrium polystomum]|nr:hypothetical protein DFJ73DRAFT_874706 [Zopfochytrium polystomum]